MKIVALIMGVLALTVSFAFAQQAAKPELNGLWAVKYADGSEGTMKVEKNLFILTVPAGGEIKRAFQVMGDYFECILRGRMVGVNFLFGYLKSNGIEGKLQERVPCAELKKAFKSGIAESESSCQLPVDRNA